MKIRTSFVANSSSLSFLISVKDNETPFLNINGSTYDLDSWYGLNDVSDYDEYCSVYCLASCFKDLNSIRKDIARYLKFQYECQMNVVKDSNSIDSKTFINYIMLVADKIIQYVNNLLKGKHLRKLTYSAYIEKYLPEYKSYINYVYISTHNSNKDDVNKVIGLIESFMNIVNKESPSISNSIIEEYYYASNSNEIKDTVINILVSIYFRVFNNFYIYKTHNVFKQMEVPNNREDKIRDVDDIDTVSYFINENELDFISKHGNFEIVSVG